MMGAGMGGRYELHACGWICRGGVTQGRLECGLSIYPAWSGVKAEVSYGLSDLGTRICGWRCVG